MSTQTPRKAGTHKLSSKANALHQDIITAITSKTFNVVKEDLIVAQRLTRLKLDTITSQRCSSYVKTIMEVDKPENELYKPVTKLLTEISCFVHRMHVEKGFTSALTDKNLLLMFIIRASSDQDADNGEVPDIVGVDATAEEVRNYLEKDVLPDRLVSLHWSQLLSVGHIKLAEMPDDWDTDDLVQLLSYVWCTDRYQPNRFVHTAIMAYKTGFLTLQCLPDSMAVSSNHSYHDHDALVRYVYALYYPGSRAETQPCDALEFTNLKPIQRCSDEPKIKASATALQPSFKYTVQGDNETAEYSVFDHFHGSSFSRQGYVGLGAMPPRAPNFHELSC
ncbi:hypothetical protein JB92DRAFT_3109036 [Gautieria morchelliformis]|nr:hypothetical protein JB92DRAFT_3109036 [Gautieria morchelliformis]